MVAASEFIADGRMAGAEAVVGRFSLCYIVLVIASLLTSRPALSPQRLSRKVLPGGAGCTLAGIWLRLSGGASHAILWAALDKSCQSREHSLCVSRVRASRLLKLQPVFPPAVPQTMV